MGKVITSIPAKVNLHTHEIAKAKRRVAGYARVSTDMEEQQTSYKAQLEYYTNYIKNHQDWIFVDVYTDEGISGLNIKRREGFNKMIEDALDGKIDLIITKSVSRFARNTVDSLTTIRKLKENGVEVYFEKENIWTFDGKGELLLTIMSSLAQEESRSISENCTWGQRKRMADGKVTVPYTRFLGYDQGKNGELVINEEQAEIVRYIYKLFLEGKSPYKISKILTASDYKTVYGKKTWYKSTITNVLKNEKYKGDALLQKFYTSDFLNKKLKKNNGEVQQYYISGNHEPIISPDVWDYVQEEFKKRTRYKKSDDDISQMIRCGVCGGLFYKKFWHSNDKYRKIVWQCKTKSKCKTSYVCQDEIKQIFIRAVNQIIANKDTMLSALEEIKSATYNEDELAAKQQKAYDKLEEKTKEYQQLCEDPLQNGFEEKYEKIKKEVDERQKEYTKISDEYSDLKYRFSQATYFCNKLQEQNELITEFDPMLWRAIVDHIIVYSKEKITVMFKDGTEI